MRRWAMPIALLMVVAAAGMTLYVAIHQASQRDRAILIECNDQNFRHDQTIRALNLVLADALKQAKTPARRAQIAESRTSTILLINALAPKRDCQHVLATLS